MSDRDDEGCLTAVSSKAVGNLLKRVKSRGLTGLKQKDSYLNRCDLIDKPENRVEATVESNVRKGKNIALPHPDSEQEEDDDESIWEDVSYPTSTSANTHTHDIVNEVTIEFGEGTPDSGKRKTIRRATAKDKELAELIHKVHLLCLLARGRLIDSACDDLLIQASLLSLLPDHFMRISNTTNLRVNDLASLVKWLHDNFRVRSPSNTEKSIPSALQFAVGNSEGSAEEVTALSVALFRALNLTTRFVAVLDVTPLKPEADKPESVDLNPSKARKNIFQSSTPMVDINNQGISSPIKQSSSNGKGNTRAKSSKALDHSLENIQTDGGPTMNSGGPKRKGDLEFEMQLEMALASTAVGNSNNLELSSPPAKKLKTIKPVEFSFSQGVSTAYGSKKVGAPLYWAEVYCCGENSTGKWVHIDVVNNIVNAEDRVEAAAAACKNSLRYVVAFAGLGAKDVTRRYCTKWYKIEKHRSDSAWWDNTLAPLKELESRATSGVFQLKPFDANTLAKVEAVEVSEQSSATNRFVPMRSSLEDMELETRALTEPLPTNQQAYRNHNLYALERWLTKYQILHPKGPILGFCSGHPVYPRTCVQILHSKIRWLREGLQVRANEFPAKVLKRTVKNNKEHASEADDEIQDDDGKNTELYGMWQTEPLCLPPAVDGKVPKNERGQVDVWSEKCLPPGTVHLRLPRVFLVAKRLGIDYAPAMVGFEFRKGGSIPVFDGIVVCTEFKDSILEAYAEEEERREAEEKKRNEAQAISRWYQLLSSIVTRQRLNVRYGSVSVSTTSNVTPETKDTNQDDRHSSEREEENLREENKDVVSMVQTEEHEHVFSIIDQDHDEVSFTKTKRCHCGFSIQVEEL